MPSPHGSEEGRVVLESRPPKALWARAALGTASLSLLSALWAYLEYAGEKREPLLALALAGVFFGMGFTIVLTFRGSFTFRTERGPRELEGAGTSSNPPVAETLELSDKTRRRRFTLLLGTGLTGLLAILLLPLRSLGTKPSLALRKTSWRRGARLAMVNGRPLLAANLPPGTSVPFVPEGASDDGNSFGLLVRLHRTAPDDPLRGLRAFSSICTHAGCAVSIFLDESALLVCPCHWSTFSAEDGRIVSGPASQPLPELPISVDSEGYLIADGDFTRPIGPRLGCAGCNKTRMG